MSQRFSPADRAGLDKMDYVWTVNGKEVCWLKSQRLHNRVKVASYSGFYIWFAVLSSDISVISSVC